MVIWMIVATAWIGFQSFAQRRKQQNADSSPELERSLLQNGAASTFMPRMLWHLQNATKIACFTCLALAVYREICGDYRHSSIKLAGSRLLRKHFKEMNAKPNELYVLWATSIPFEDMGPLDNLRWLTDARSLLFWLAATNGHAPTNESRIRNQQCSARMGKSPKRAAYLSRGLLQYFPHLFPRASL